MSELPFRLRRFAPVLAAGGIAWTIGLGLALWTEPNPVGLVAAAVAWLSLLAAGVVGDARLSRILGIYVYLAAVAVGLATSHEPNRGVLGRLLFSLSWIAFAWAWGSLAARDLPGAAAGLERPVDESRPLTPRRVAPRIAFWLPAALGAFGLALLAPLGLAGPSADERPERAVLLQLFGAGAAIGLLGLASQWGAALHFVPALRRTERLRRAAPALALAVGLLVWAVVRWVAPAP